MIGIGYAVGIGVGMFLLGFVACSCFAMGRQDELESALWWLARDPANEKARANAVAALTGE
jgi:hypothetical protein